MLRAHRDRAAAGHVDELYQHVVGGLRTVVEHRRRHRDQVVDLRRRRVELDIARQHRQVRRGRRLHRQCHYRHIVLFAALANEAAGVHYNANAAVARPVQRIVDDRDRRARTRLQQANDVRPPDRRNTRFRHIEELHNNVCRILRSVIEHNRSYQHLVAFRRSGWIECYVARLHNQIGRRPLQHRYTLRGLVVALAALDNKVARVGDHLNLSLAFLVRCVVYNAHRTAAAGRNQRYRLRRSNRHRRPLRRVHELDRHVARRRASVIHHHSGDDNPLPLARRFRRMCHIGALDRQIRQRLVRHLQGRSRPVISLFRLGNVVVRVNDDLYPRVLLTRRVEHNLCYAAAARGNPVDDLRLANRQPLSAALDELYDHLVGVASALIQHGRAYRHLVAVVRPARVEADIARFDYQIRN